MRRASRPTEESAAWGPAFGYYRERPPIGAWLRYESGRPCNSRWFKVTRVTKRGTVYGRAHYASGKVGAERNIGSVQPWRFD